jgi:single-stranded-DNA-specific exonuclease
MPELIARSVPATALAALTRDGVAPVLARVFAARGLTDAEQLSDDMARLLPPQALTRCDAAARALADAIERRERLLIVADYDCDGATACAVGVRALRAFGAEIDYIVPNRFEYGYGLTPEIVDLARNRRPDWLITVDNGIASVEGVERAHALGLRVLVTDHHLPGDQLPQAEVIVNPNQPGCSFPSKHLAGVGVMFYVMLALRAELRQRGRFDGGQEPNLGALLDLVALGTVADVVRLDANNRILVAQGLKRIRAGRACPGISALLRVAGRVPERCATYDLGFVAGPRLNAAGRLSDMSLGIECLITDDHGRAGAIAGELDRLNRERRSIESGMREQAFELAESIDTAATCTLSLFQPDWHQGVIGIVAGRVKDRLHRPVVAFARGDGGELKGSGRSIAGLHLRDALDLVSKRAPGLLHRFGGHAAAAGLTIAESALPQFSTLFEEVVRSLVSDADLARRIETDGPLAAGELSLDLARSLEHGVWGQGFPAPDFADSFRVARQKVVGERHLKLQLERDGVRYEAILFDQPGPLPPRIAAVYRPTVNRWQGLESLQLTLSHWDAAGDGSKAA